MPDVVTQRGYGRRCSSGWTAPRRPCTQTLLLGAEVVLDPGRRGSSTSTPALSTGFSATVESTGCAWIAACWACGRGLPHLRLTSPTGARGTAGVSLSRRAW
jgi:hypothetical protein